MSELVPRVSVVMPFLNTVRFIAEAIDSVRAQTYGSWELLLVDDGSTDGSADVARAYAEREPERIRLLAHPDRANHGTSAATNLGLRHARGELIALLDSDDVWLPNKLAEQVPLLDAHPEVGCVYGNTLYWHSWTGAAEDRDRDWMPALGVAPGTVLAPPTLLVENLRERAAVPCTCSILMRRALVERVGGHEESFRRNFTDQALYAKLFVEAPVLVAGGCWDRYRQHPGSVSRAMANAGGLAQATLTYLTWLEGYLDARDIRHPELRRALDARLWPFRHPHLHRARRLGRRYRRAAAHVAGALASRLLPAGPRARVRRMLRAQHPAPGLVRFGSLRRTSPISRIWGRDRGRSLDRYYVEGFLERHRADVRGRVLEVGDATYTRRFGGDRVERADVLHVTEGNPHATIVADLASADHVPSDAFDCIILTQTLQLIYDVPAALRTVRRILKPGGVLLATFPGITHTGDADWQGTWYWSFTANSARRLFGDAFGAAHVRVESHGNVLAATAFLYGLADDELRPAELDAHDPSYDVIVAVRAVKPAGP